MNYSPCLTYKQAMQIQKGMRVWTSSFRLLPVEILSIPTCVALFVTHISLLFRYHLCSFVQLNVSIEDFCQEGQYLP
jgi:hypothetical protein